jgi:phospholipase/carboxylesterase
MRVHDQHRVGQLTSALGRPAGPGHEPGLHPLTPEPGAQHLLFLPAQPHGTGDAGSGAAATPLTSRPRPLVVLFHGSGSDPFGMLRLVEQQAAAAGVAVLLPKSSGYTWDAVLGAFGPDVAELDRLLEMASGMLPIDPDRLAVGGFSDGASYALSLGRINGDRFRHILAFSPGFVVPGPPAGTPRIFVSHGTADTVLPIDRCSRLLAPVLKREGYAVDYREFDGGHVVPPELVEEAFRVIAGAPAAE